MTPADLKQGRLVWVWTGASFRWLPASVIRTYRLGGQLKVWLALVPRGMATAALNDVAPRSPSLMGKDKPPRRDEDTPQTMLVFGEYETAPVGTCCRDFMRRTV